MSVDIAIELACEPRVRLGADGLLAAVKAQGQAAVVEQLAAREGRPPEQIRVGLGGGGTLDYGALRSRAAALEGLDRYCAGCPANLFRPAFGCLTAIRYPIGADALAWLVARLPARSDAPPGSEIVRALRDFSLDGARGAEMRRRGLVEGAGPAMGQVGDVAVSSDQLLELLLFARHGTAAMRMLLLAFGAVEPVPEDRVIAAYRGEVPLRPALLPGDDDERSVGDFKRLFLAFLVASRLESPVRIAP